MEAANLQKNDTPAPPAETTEPVVAKASEIGRFKLNDDDISKASKALKVDGSLVKVFGDGVTAYAFVKVRGPGRPLPQKLITSGQLGYVEAHHAVLSPSVGSTVYRAPSGRSAALVIHPYRVL